MAGLVVVGGALGVCATQTVIKLAMVNRLKGRARKKQNFQGFMAEGEQGTSEFIIASKAGLKWRSYEDAILIAAGSEDSEALDAELAAQLGRTPGAVRARRAKLKKLGKL